MSSYNYTDKGYVSKYGGGVLKVREVDDAGTYTSGDDYNLGYIQETNFKFEKPKEDISDETGNTIKTIFGNATFTLSGVFMESSTALLDFLRDTTEGKYYQLYYKMTPTGDLNGVTQELFGAICMITPKFELASGTRRPPFEITFLKNDAAITITTPNSVFGSVETDTVTIPIGKYYDIVEN